MVELHVADLERSWRFYDHLGLTTTGRGEDWADLLSGASHLPLAADAYLRTHPHYFSDHLDARPRGVGVEICIEVREPVDDVATRLASSVVREPTDRPWGVRDVRLADPDGYFLRITEPLHAPHPARAPDTRDTRSTP